MSEISDAKLLVIDDDPMNREILFRHLKNLGYSDITLTDGGKSGLEIVASNSIDLILLDMMMPVMNGLETLTHLKDNYQSRVIPVIIISALDEKEMMLACIQIGVWKKLKQKMDERHIKRCPNIGHEKSKH
jgi:sigma-B regulation protein RsbU (phosphoserine phosphatase)